MNLTETWVQIPGSPLIRYDFGNFFFISHLQRGDNRGVVRMKCVKIYKVLRKYKNPTPVALIFFFFFFILVGHMGPVLWNGFHNIM